MYMSYEFTTHIPWKRLHISGQADEILCLISTTYYNKKS